MITLAYDYFNKAPVTIFENKILYYPGSNFFLGGGGRCEKTCLKNIPWSKTISYSKYLHMTICLSMVIYIDISVISDGHGEYNLHKGLCRGGRTMVQ